MPKKISQPDAIIFDLDGTLFKTETIIISVYHATFDQLRKEGLYSGNTPPNERILSSLGMLLEDLWEKVMPDASDQAAKRASELLLQYEIEYLEKGQGELYPEVKDTLQILHERGIRLFVASNGLELYVKKVVEKKGLGPLFEKIYSAGEFQTQSKVDLVRILLSNHGIQNAWMVGDRSSDVEAGKANGLVVIGCEYAGFGQDQELKEADYVISTFGEIASL